MKDRKMSGSKNVPPPAASVVPFRRSVAAYEGEQELSVGLPPCLGKYAALPCSRRRGCS